MKISGVDFGIVGYLDEKLRDNITNIHDVANASNEISTLSSDLNNKLSAFKTA